MNNKLFFSIIIPTYNRAQFIVHTINSVLQQTYSNFEIIVVDDGSTDNTIEIISKIEDQRFRFISIPNKERAVARNTGAKFAKGNYLNFVDSDDLLLPNHLEVAQNAIEEKGRPEFIHLNYEVHDNQNNLLRTGIKLGRNGTANKLLIRGNSLSCNGVFLRHDIALQYQFNEDRNLSASEDYELWLRLGSRFDLHTVDTPTSIIIAHTGRSVVNTNLTKLVNRKELLVKYAFEDRAVHDTYGKNKKKLIAFCDTYIALHLVLHGMIREGLLYLIKGIRTHPACLNDRRILGILKQSSIHFINTHVKGNN